MSSWRRMGGFLIALGILFMALFVLSDSVSQAEFSLLAGGFGLLVVGIFLWVTHPAPAPPPATRFRVLSRRKGEPAPKREQARGNPGPKPLGPPASAGKQDGKSSEGKPSAKPAGPPGGSNKDRGGKPGAQSGAKK
jgi:hypothetical protein